MNILFTYLYRDAANYKQYGQEVFSNDENLALPYILEIIIDALIEREFFIAYNWGVKDLYFSSWDRDIDHDYHEFSSVEETSEKATTGNIADFLVLIRPRSRMKEIIQSNIISTPYNPNYKFVNIVTYLRDTFRTNPIVFAPTSYKEMSDLLPLQKTIKLKNRIVEDNLRMIESYMPEILFAFALVPNQPKSLSMSITELSEQIFLMDKPKPSKMFLQQKLFSLLEAMLYRDIFGVIGAGDIIDDICYVYKDDTELRYYRYYQVRTLLVSIMDEIQILTTISGDSRVLNFKYP